ncbi:uncharacterized protein [Oryza sativa Japonica Group]|uniref:Expressed protein n=5 Tax=Oryza TaxID=4527 RepID=Q53JV2_ORYSJ|nr:uncharacterized protein LOC4350369 isoform X2 [Oryza sativa Japonica Group]XP_052135343.1 uncharacterized protein LOC127753933 [Oryza glaberrima]KAB8115069.1 hypothetical protein EE612_055091 [Oryza sativa]AAX95942.1 expressed protein [Oryza sativa Japonica Group]ABA93083.1 expressed protein [Oryza sativa Japonica Group]KAF2910619.1 hypothetical protein DAI22_11g114800 [Oryza sativa Japonica Group]BAF28130.1 Os11g0421800 [Oryza sativa Japonica Group]|eukprot:NP_001067767.1 Os11g0421800 [Oryza sativa Japonica Group]
MKERVRRRRIPAFGEWNYDGDGDLGGGGGCYGYGYRDGDWPVTQYFDSAMQARGLVISLPPSPKPPKKAVKWIDSGALGEEEVVDEKQRQRQHKVVVGLAVAGGEHGAARKQGKQSRVADGGAHAAMGYKGCRPAVVKAVDRDLYEIPPDMLCNKPRKRVTRSLWMGCLGLSCVA